MVQLVQHVGTGIRSRRPVYFKQWRVIDSQRHVGYLSFNPGSRICYIIPNLDPLEKKRIEEEALALTGWKNMADSVSAPEVPEELRIKEEEDDLDDIDTGLD